MLDLYDLSNDPGERSNLSDKMPAQTALLHAPLVRWREQTGAPVPTQPNPKFNAEFEQRAIEKTRTTQ